MVTLSAAGFGNIPKFKRFASETLKVVGVKVVVTISSPDVPLFPLAAFTAA